LNYQNTLSAYKYKVLMKYLIILLIAIVSLSAFKDGIVYDAKELLADVRKIVSEAKAEVGDSGE